MFVASLKMKVKINVVKVVKSSEAGAGEQMCRQECCCPNCKFSVLLPCTLHSASTHWTCQSTGVWTWCTLCYGLAKPQVKSQWMIASSAPHSTSQTLHVLQTWSRLVSLWEICEVNSEYTVEDWMIGHWRSNTLSHYMCLNDFQTDSQ